MSPPTKFLDTDFTTPVTSIQTQNLEGHSAFGINEDSIPFDFSTSQEAVETWGLFSEALLSLQLSKEAFLRDEKVVAYFCFYISNPWITVNSTIFLSCTYNSSLPCELGLCCSKSHYKSFSQNFLQTFQISQASFQPN